MNELPKKPQPFKIRFKSSQEKFSLKMQDFITISDSQYESYDGTYEVTPMAYNSQILPTTNKILKDDITVLKVPFFTVDNQYGQTVSIAEGV